MLGISLIGYDFPIDSLFHIVFLSLSLTMIFPLLTYSKEIKLYKYFDKDKEIEEVKHRDLTETPSQRHTVDYLYRQISAHKEKVIEQQLQLNMHGQTITEFVYDIKAPMTVVKLLADQEKNQERK